MTFPTKDDVIFISQDEAAGGNVTWTVPTPDGLLVLDGAHLPLPCCRTCLFWETDLEEAGECESMDFNEAVWAKLGGGVMTKPTFRCEYYEAKDGDQ